MVYLCGYVTNCKAMKTYQVEKMRQIRTAMLTIRQRMERLGLFCENASAIEGSGNEDLTELGHAIQHVSMQMTDLISDTFEEE